MDRLIDSPLPDLPTIASTSNLSVVDYSSLKCNASISSFQSSFLSSSFSSSSSTAYALGLSTPDSISLFDDQAPHSTDCRLLFSVQPGQRIRLTLYNLGLYQGYEAAAPGPGSQSALPRPSCQVRAGHGRAPYGIDDARRNCQLRRREQLLMTTNGTQATLLLSNGFQAMVATGRKWNHILKMEGRQWGER